MKKIGLTGGIGSGKSYISTVFKKIGFPVFDADLNAKKCMHENKELRLAIINLFGSNIYNNGKLQTRELASIVFSDQIKLNALNQVVHPVVTEEFKNWCKNQDSDFVIKEAAILFESNTYKDLDFIISVSAPIEIRVKRVVSRDGCTVNQVKERMRSQISDKERQKRADFLILNDGSSLLLPQILEVIDRIKYI